MDKYIWESDATIQDVIKSFIALTDKPNMIDRHLFDYKEFNYKYLGLDRYQFTLWFHYGLWHRISYQPIPIKCIIKPIRKGCRIEAHQQRFITIIDTIGFFVYIIAFYIIAILPIINGFKSLIIVSILFGILATCMLIRFLYTQKQWKSENALFDLIDCVASAKRQQCY